MWFNFVLGLNFVYICFVLFLVMYDDEFDIGKKKKRKQKKNKKKAKKKFEPQDHYNIELTAVLQ